MVCKKCRRWFEDMDELKLHTCLENVDFLLEVEKKKVEYLTNFIKKLLSTSPGSDNPRRAVLEEARDEMTSSTESLKPKIVKRKPAVKKIVDIPIEKDSIEQQLEQLEQEKLNKTFPLIAPPPAKEFHTTPKRYQYIRYYSRQSYIKILEKNQSILNQYEKRYIMPMLMDMVSPYDAETGELYSKAVELHLRDQELFDEENLSHICSPLVGIYPIEEFISRALKGKVTSYKNRIYYLSSVDPENFWKNETFMIKFIYDLRNYIVDFFRKLYQNTFGDLIVRNVELDDEMRMTLRNLVLIDSYEIFYEKVKGCLVIEKTGMFEKVKDPLPFNYTFNPVYEDIYGELLDEDIKEFNNLIKTNNAGLR